MARDIQRSHQTEREAKATVSCKLGTSVKLSLRTRDAAAADTRRLIVLGELSKLYGAVRTGTVSLTQKQIVGLAGEVYGLLLQHHDDNPGEAASWEPWKARSASMHSPPDRLPHSVTSPGT